MHFQLHNHELLKKLVGTKSLNTLVENLAQYQSSPPFLLGELAWGDFKSSYHRYLPGGITMFLKHAHFLHNVIEENIELIGYDNNNKMFHWVYLFTLQARVGFLQKF